MLKERTLILHPLASLLWARRPADVTIRRSNECVNELRDSGRPSDLAFVLTSSIIYLSCYMLYHHQSPAPSPVRVRNRTSSTSLAAISPRTLSCTSTRVSLSHFALSCATRQLRLAYSPKGAVSLGLRRGALRSFPVGFDDPVTPPLRWRIFPH